MRRFFSLSQSDHPALIVKRQGQSVSEYAIPLALLAVVAIGILSAIGNNVSGMFAGTIKVKTPVQSVQSLGAPTTTASLLGTSSPQQAAAISSSVGPAAPGTYNLSLRLSNGAQLQLTGYPSNISESIETIGTNGTTEKLLAVLEQTIAKLEASGADPVELQNLKNLANAGHKIAKSQADIEISYQDGGPRFYNRFNPEASRLGLQGVNALNFCPYCGATGNTVPLNREELAVYNQLANKNVPYVDEDQGGTAYRNYAGPDLYQFIKEYTLATKTGLLRDNPEVKAIVAALSQPIMVSSADMSKNIQGVSALGGCDNYENLNNVACSIKTMREQTAYSVETHGNSAQICATGNGQDSGIHCSS